jgi:hypothetical protein
MVRAACSRRSLRGSVILWLRAQRLLSAFVRASQVDEESRLKAVADETD